MTDLSLKEYSFQDFVNAVVSHTKQDCNRNLAECLNEQRNHKEEPLWFGAVALYEIVYKMDEAHNRATSKQTIQENVELLKTHFQQIHTDMQNLSSEHSTCSLFLFVKENMLDRSFQGLTEDKVPQWDAYHSGELFIANSHFNENNDIVMSYNLMRECHFYLSSPEHSNSAKHDSIQEFSFSFGNQLFELNMSINDNIILLNDKNVLSTLFTGYQLNNQMPTPHIDFSDLANIDISLEFDEPATSFTVAYPAP